MIINPIEYFSKPERKYEISCLTIIDTVQINSVTVTDKVHAVHIYKVLLLYPVEEKFRNHLYSDVNIAMPVLVFSFNLTALAQGDKP